jgi:hypothetical protein
VIMNSSTKDWISDPVGTVAPRLLFLPLNISRSVPLASNDPRI